MTIQQVMVFVDESDQERRRRVEAGVTRVLTTYPGSIFAEVSEAQASQLETEGFHLEALINSAKIKLRSIEFDPVTEVPSVPAAMKMREVEPASTEENYWIVQFVGPVKVEWSDTIQGLGGHVGDRAIADLHNHPTSPR